MVVGGLAVGDGRDGDVATGLQADIATGGQFGAGQAGVAAAGQLEVAASLDAAGEVLGVLAQDTSTEKRARQMMYLARFSVRR
nr:MULTISPECIES: hypothetical protein [unclassified Microbulbifer]